jgi:hypothetical protein
MVAGTEVLQTPEHFMEQAWDGGIRFLCIMTLHPEGRCVSFSQGASAHYFVWTSEASTS